MSDMQVGLKDVYLSQDATVCQSIGSGRRAYRRSESAESLFFGRRFVWQAED